MRSSEGEKWLGLLLTLGGPRHLLKMLFHQRNKFNAQTNINSPTVIWTNSTVLSLWYACCVYRINVCHAVIKYVSVVFNNTTQPI